MIQIPIRYNEKKYYTQILNLLNVVLWNLSPNPLMVLSELLCQYHEKKKEGMKNDEQIWIFINGEEEVKKRCKKFGYMKSVYLGYIAKLEKRNITKNGIIDEKWLKITPEKDKIFQVKWIV